MEIGAEQINQAYEEIASMVMSEGNRLGMGTQVEYVEDREANVECLDISRPNIRLVLQTRTVDGEEVMLVYPFAIEHYGGYFNPRTGAGEGPSDEEIPLAPQDGIPFVLGGANEHLQEWLKEKFNYAADRIKWR